MKNEPIITDQEFINSLDTFNLEARHVVIKTLVQIFKSTTTLSEKDRKAICLCVFENYMAITEMVLMLIITFKEWNRREAASLFKTYSNIYIKEQTESKYNSEKLLKDLQTKTPEELLNLLGFCSFQTFYADLSDQPKLDFHRRFGNDNSKIQKDFEQEVKNVFDALVNAVKGRISDKDGNYFPFYKLFNKIKHGYQVVSDPETDRVKILLFGEEGWEEYGFNCKEEFTEKLLENATIITQSMRNLLHYYMLSID